MDFKADETGNYDLFMRYSKSEHGGKISLYLDEQLLDSIDTINNSDAFSWEKITSVWLTKGSHSLSIENGKR